MIKILVCIKDSLLKLRINRVLLESKSKFEITEKPIKKDDLIFYDIVIIHSSYNIYNLNNFIENSVLQEITTFFYLTTNTKSNSFRKFKDHLNLVFINENRMDIELPLAINLFSKYSKQIKEITKKNKKLEKSLEEIKLINACKKYLIKKGYTEDNAHKYILKYAMNNHISKIEASNRILSQ